MLDRILDLGKHLFNIVYGCSSSSIKTILVINLSFKFAIRCIFLLEKYFSHNIGILY